MKIPQVIAIDGPAASGKSTLGEKIADHLDYLYFDTGVMYRAVTWSVMKAGIKIEDEEKVAHVAEAIKIEVLFPSIEDGRKCDVLVDGKDVTWDIRSAAIEDFVSQVASYSGVRKAMTEQQRRIVFQTLRKNHSGNIHGTSSGNDPGKMSGIVMVGRDIGTVVVPDAGLKIYLVASVEERARRRFEEAVKIDPKTSYQEICNSMLRRDKIDSTRTIAPLKPADDAIIINTDGIDIDEVFSRVINLLE